MANADGGSGSGGTLVSCTSPVPAPSAPAIGSGGTGGVPSLALEAELDEAAAELLDDVLEEAAEAAFERVARGTKKFAFLAAPWCSDSASAARFFSALAAVIEDLCFAPVVLPLPAIALLLLSPLAEREPDFAKTALPHPRSPVACAPS